MYRFGSRQAADEATGATRIVRILFDEFTLQQGHFDLVDIQIIFKPFLLGMNTDFITTFPN